MNLLDDILKYLENDTETLARMVAKECYEKNGTLERVINKTTRCVYCPYYDADDCSENIQRAMEK